MLTLTKSFVFLLFGIIVASAFERLYTGSIHNWMNRAVIEKCGNYSGRLTYYNDDDDFQRPADYIKVCHRSDPEIDKCIMNSVELLRPKMIEGIPELGVPPLEPLRLGVVKLSRGPQNARVDLNVTDLLVHGPGEFITKSLKSNINKNRFDFRILLPHISFKGRYSINMRILLLRLKGQGPITGNITNLQCDVRIQGHKEKRDDSKEYLRFEKFRIKLTIGPTKFKLDNLFNGDPTLERIANNVINSTPEFFVEEVKPALEAGLSDVFTEISNGIMNKFPYEELFPE